MSVSPRLSTAAAAVAGLILTLAVGQPAAAGPLDAYLPKGGQIAGHVVTLSVSEEDQAISLRFKLAVQQNMEWFKNAVAGSAPGKPLPYDKRMAISEAEYDRLLHMTPELKQGAAVTVEVDKAADGTIGFKPHDPEVQPLKDVTFPAAEDVAATQYGKLKVFSEMHQRDAPWGAWDGAEWAQVMPPDSEQPSVKIAFGKRASDGQGVMYYQVAPYKDHEEQSLVVFYKLD